MEFHPALGDIDELPDAIRPLFASDRFHDKRPPEPADWLAVRDESGQTFDAYVASDPNRPDDRRDTIYALPLGAFESGRAPPPEHLEQFGRAFFQMPFEVMAPVAIDDAGLTERDHPREGQRQLLTRDILPMLENHLPEDAFCLVGITMVDLYPDPSWNFVFGEASLKDRVGVYSFARYQSPDPALTLFRSLKVMAHETGHMFGIQHCPYFECLMNGTNNLPEADRRPAFLCPVDLRKLMWSVEFDPVARYRELGEAYEAAGLDGQAERAWGLAAV